MVRGGRVCKGSWGKGRAKSSVNSTQLSVLLESFSVESVTTTTAPQEHLQNPQNNFLKVVLIVYKIILFYFFNKFWQITYPDNICSQTPVRVAKVTLSWKHHRKVRKLQKYIFHSLRVRSLSGKTPQLFKFLPKRKLWLKIQSNRVIRWWHKLLGSWENIRFLNIFLVMVNSITERHSWGIYLYCS